MSKKSLVPIVLPANPTQPLEAATKQYVDTRDAADIPMDPAGGWGVNNIEAVINYLNGQVTVAIQSVVISLTDPIATNPNAELWFDPDA